MLTRARGCKAATPWPPLRGRPLRGRARAKGSGQSIVKPARLHFARTARALTGRCVSEASCPNFQPRAHAGLTGLTSQSKFLVVHYLYEGVGPYLTKISCLFAKFLCDGHVCASIYKIFWYCALWHRFT